MAKNLHRLTDRNTAGAPIIQVLQNSVYENNLLVSVDGSPVAGHGPGPHSSPVTANGSNHLFIENIRVNRLYDPDSCGHQRIAGSPNTFIGDE